MAGRAPGRLLGSRRVTVKWVFALDEVQFSPSEDNKPGASDYYVSPYMDPAHASPSGSMTGGWLRDAPAVVPVVPAGQDWELANYQNEIAMLQGYGFDGYELCIQSFDTTPSQQYRRMLKMIAAAKAARFMICLLPDFTAGWASTITPASFAAKMQPLLTATAGLMPTTPSGVPIMTSFRGEVKDTTWWTQALTALAGQGTPVAWHPCFLDPSNARAYDGLAYGNGLWAERSPKASTGVAHVQTDAAAAGKPWAQMVSIMDTRPDQAVAAESCGPGNLIVTAAQANTAEMVRIIINDFSENTYCVPSRKSGASWMQILQPYIAAWKGLPAPAMDEAYVIHRIHRSSFIPTAYTKHMSLKAGSDPFTDLVYVLTRLAAPGTINGIPVPAGEQVTTFALPTSGSFTATVTRPGLSDLVVSSAQPVQQAPVVQDLNYYAACAVAPSETPAQAIARLTQQVTYLQGRITALTAQVTFDANYDAEQQATITSLTDQLTHLQAAVTAAIATLETP
jgi:hypothetical protein